MKNYFRIIAIGLALVSCSTLNSDLTVQPGKQFRLGGNQKGAFTVQLRNIGKVPVTISELPVNGQRVVLGTFRPGEGQTVRFSAGSAALVDNTSERPARVSLVVSGDKGLDMRDTGNK